MESKVKVGDNVTIKKWSLSLGGVVIEDNVFIGPSVVFTNDSNPRSKKYEVQTKKTLIKKGSSIGANATIFLGLQLENMRLWERIRL